MILSDEQLKGSINSIERQLLYESRELLKEIRDLLKTKKGVSKK